MTAADLEDDIVARLKSDAELTTAMVTNVNVIPMPDTDTMFDFFEKAFQSPKVAVVWGGGATVMDRVRNSSIKDTTTVVQDEDMVIDIFINGSDLRGPNGIYVILARIKRLLLGYMPANMWRKMYLIAEEPSKEARAKGVSLYIMRWGTMTTIVEDTQLTNPATSITSPTQLSNNGPNNNASGPPLSQTSFV